ncbi:hypothetical protein ONZ45_g4273 [Pleurotus djamor]|nr:hypothetical protein ONZ45_g4273 [Pleurotus djamor]
MTDATHGSSEINIQIESFEDDSVSVHGVENSNSPYQEFSEFVCLSDEENRWTSGSSGPSSPANHPTITLTSKDPQFATASHANVHVRNDSSSSLNIHHLTPPPIRPTAVDTSFLDYRTTIQDPIFSPEEAFAGHEFPDPSTDDDGLLFGPYMSSAYTGSFTNDGQLPSPVESQLDLSSFALQSAPVLDNTAIFLQVPSRPNRPRSNTHEGTVPTVAPRDVFQPTSLSSPFSDNDYADSAVADDYLPSPHSPIDSMKSTSSTLFGAVQEPYIAPVIKADNRRRKSDTGVMTTKPSAHQLQARFNDVRAQANLAAYSIPIAQQPEYQSLPVYQNPSTDAVIPDMTMIHQRAMIANANASRGRGIARSNPASRRHSPYPQVNKLPSPTSEQQSPYHDLIAISDSANATDFIKPEDQDLPLTTAPSMLGRNRTAPAGNPNHVPLALNANLRRSPSNPVRGKFDTMTMFPPTPSVASANSNHSRHVSMNDQLFRPIVKSEMVMPSLHPPVSMNVPRQTITSDATREAANKRRTKPPKFFCHCGENFTARHNYERHLQAHDGIRPFLCACHTAFTSKSDRKRHIDKSKKDECKLPPIDL